MPVLRVTTRMRCGAVQVFRQQRVKGWKKYFVQEEMRPVDYGSDALREKTGGRRHRRSSNWANGMDDESSHEVGVVSYRDYNMYAFNNNYHFRRVSSTTMSAMSSVVPVSAYSSTTTLISNREVCGDVGSNKGDKGKEELALEDADYEKVIQGFVRTDGLMII
ncbi:MAG: hypothetical protein LQ342_005477 [Letrouitia transgressa]|nr:MAG: hypothetical protein LQ342_005477 [Letrouitia transgressa]